MSKQKIIIVLALATALSGCASLNKTADKLGVNFWTKGAKKAPCKSVSSSPDDIPCIGVPLDKPTDDEILKLRGRYIVINSVVSDAVSVAP